MNVIDNWNTLNARMKEENEEAIAGLFQIHMGAFDDLRKNGHKITADGQPASILAATLEPKDCFSLACQIGRSLIVGTTGNINNALAEICTIQHADLFPNCIAIALGAMLENIHPGPPNEKIPVMFIYEKIKGNNDPLIDKLRVLEPCFPWADFRMNVKEKEQPIPVQAPVLPLDQMTAIFRADGVFKIALGRTGFSGEVIRGEIHKGDVLIITDGQGQKIAPSGLVMDLSIKDRIEDGEVIGEKADTVVTGQHLDCLLLAVELPKGSYNSIMLCKENPKAKEETNQNINNNSNTESPMSEKTDELPKKNQKVQEYDDRKTENKRQEGNINKSEGILPEKHIPDKKMCRIRKELDGCVLKTLDQRLTHQEELQINSTTSEEELRGFIQRVYNSGKINLYFVQKRAYLLITPKGDQLVIRKGQDVPAKSYQYCFIEILLEMSAALNKSEFHISEQLANVLWTEAEPGLWLPAMYVDVKTEWNSREIITIALLCLFLVGCVLIGIICR